MTGAPPAALSSQLQIHVCAYMELGKWYRWEDVVKAVTPRVPREAAGRRGYADWVGQSTRRTGHPPAARPIAQAHVLAGSRTLIRNAVDNVKDAFEWRGPRTHREIRLLRIPEHILDYVVKE